MSPEVKERVFARVTALIESCCEEDVCVRDPDADDETAWYEIDRDVSDDRRDVLREREWDRD